MAGDCAIVRPGSWNARRNGARAVRIPFACQESEPIRGEIDWTRSGTDFTQAWGPESSLGGHLEGTRMFARADSPHQLQLEGRSEPRKAG